MGQEATFRSLIGSQAMGPPFSDQRSFYPWWLLQNPPSFGNSLMSLLLEPLYIQKRFSWNEKDKDQVQVFVTKRIGVWLDPFNSFKPWGVGKFTKNQMVHSYGGWIAIRNLLLDSSENPQKPLSFSFEDIPMLIGFITWSHHSESLNSFRIDWFYFSHVQVQKFQHPQSECFPGQSLIHFLSCSR